MVENHISQKTPSFPSVVEVTGSRLMDARVAVYRVIAAGPPAWG